MTDPTRLLIAAGLAGAALVVLFWPRGDRRQHASEALRHPALWVLLSLAVSFAATALLHRRGIVVLGLLPFMGAWWAGRDSTPAPPPRAMPPPKLMSRTEALAVFGLTPDTTREEVLEAYSHMMWFAKADHGGSDWLIDKLNEARSVLIRN